jgi:hypothetical protein
MAEDIKRPHTTRPEEAALNPFRAIDPEPPASCCGKLMESRLAKVVDRQGETSFLAVWRCTVCNRTTI